jgi:hypothetical protein
MTLRTSFHSRLWQPQTVPRGAGSDAGRRTPSRIGD